MKRALFAIAFVFAFASATAFGQWDFAKPAPWQAAACRVVSDGGSAGSGALVEIDGVRVILTCAHVIDSAKGSARFRDGTVVKGEWTRPKQGTEDTHFDCSALIPDDPAQVSKLHALTLANGDAKRGERIEIMGFGGGQALFRPYYGRITDETYRQPQREGEWDGQHADCPVVHGDSGSVVVNERGEVIAVQNVGDGDGFAGKTAEGTGYYASCGVCPLTPIRSFLRRVAARMQCGPNGCQPYNGPSQRYSPRGGNGGGGSLYPPQDQYPTQPQQPGQGNSQGSGQAAAPLPRGNSSGDNSNGNGSHYVAPAPTPAPLPAELDYNKLAEAVIKQGGDKLRGPAGPVGPAGKDGKDGVAGRDGEPGKNADPKAIADAVSKSLPIDEIAAKAAALIDLDLIASKVVIPVNPPTNQPVRRHAVLITERSKAYWDSLSVIVSKAQTRYAGIKVADKPESEIGPMPFLAVYQNGVPVEQYRGLDEVARKLTEVSEGGAL